MEDFADACYSSCIAVVANTVPSQVRANIPLASNLYVLFHDTQICRCRILGSGVILGPSTQIRIESYYRRCLWRRSRRSTSTEKRWRLMPIQLSVCSPSCVTVWTLPAANMD